MTRNGMRGLVLPGLLLVCLSSCADNGYDGRTPQVEIFLDERGCVTQEPQTFSARIGFDVERMEAALEVFEGAVDLVLGWGEAPRNYFSLGRGPGTQKLRVGPESGVPVQAGTWYLTVAGAAGVATGCDPENPTDWHLSLQRTPAARGASILSVSCRSTDCAVPACNAYPCVFQEIPLDVPGDAVSMEVVLKSIQGDADLLVVSDTGVHLGASTNPGTGYDILVLGPDVTVPLREQTVSLRLTSWAQPTDQYDLQVTYRPGP